MASARIAIFPLPGAVLFPGMHLPLHIFEPRYRAMIMEAMSRDQRIGMIQPIGRVGQPLQQPALYGVGCVGHMSDIEAMEDGRYNVLLEGIARFNVIRELEVATPFRQVEAEYWDEDEESDVLAAVERASLEQEARAFAKHSGYEVDWDAVSQLDDHSLVNGMAQVIAFDSAAKQALLESQGLSKRASMLTQMIQFARRGSQSGDGAALQ